MEDIFNHIMFLVGSPGDSENKESVCKAGDLSQSLDSEDLLEKEMATHPSMLAWRTPKDRGAWRVTTSAITKSQTRLRDQTILKVLNLKGITLSHSYRHKKWQNRQNLLSCQGLKGTL